MKTKNVNYSTSVNYGDLIAALRTYLDMSVTEFSKLLDYTSSHIRHFEEGITVPTTEVIDKICAVYSVDKDYFLGKLPVEKACSIAVMSADDRKMATAARIKEIREQRGLSKRELERKAGIKKPGITQIEKGVSNITLKTAKKLAEALEVGVDWILCGDEGRKSYPADDKMINWLWEHPEVRKMIWEKMEKEKGNERGEDTKITEY